VQEIDPDNGKLVIWPAIIEAAFAQLNGGYGFVGTGGQLGPALEELTGHQYQSYTDMYQEELNLQSQFKAGDLITMGTTSLGTDDDPSSYDLIGQHDYTVTDVYTENNVEYVKLNNPWGTVQPDPIRVDDLAKYFNQAATVTAADANGIAPAAGVSGNNVLVGNSGDDKITGGDGTNTFIGGDGNDTLTGGKGNDTFIGGAGDDTINGGGGFNSAVYSGNQSDYDLHSYNGATGQIVDTRTGSPEGTDTITGIQRFEFADGWALYGTSGNDTLYGGAGNDKFYASSGTDTFHGNGGNDTVVYSGNFRDYTVNLDAKTQTGIVSDNRTGTPDGKDQLYGISTLQFADGKSVYGSQSNHQLSDGTGNNRLYGGAENDIFYANKGSDTISGGGGTDIVAYSGQREDYDLTYDAGAQKFIVSGAKGTDVVTGVNMFWFSDGVVLTGSEGSENFIADTFSQRMNVIGDGAPPTPGAWDNKILTGGDGDDTIVGGKGDLIVGGKGNDAITAGTNDFICGGAGNDVITGDSTDTCVYSGNQNDYQFTLDPTGQTLTITDERQTSPDGTDTVTGVGSFQFANSTSSLDELKAGATENQQVLASATGVSVVEKDGQYLLTPADGSAAQVLRLNGSAVMAGQSETLIPIAVEKCDTGYELVMKSTDSGLYNVWQTDNSGNYTKSLTGDVSGNSAILEAQETVFAKDLNGDGVIGLDQQVLNQLSNNLSQSLAKMMSNNTLFSSAPGIAATGATSDSALAATVSASNPNAQPAGQPLPGSQNDGDFAAAAAYYANSSGAAAPGISSSAGNASSGGGQVSAANHWADALSDPAVGSSAALFSVVQNSSPLDSHFSDSLGHASL